MEATRSSVPEEFLEGFVPASQPQLNFLKAIRSYRDLSSLSEEQRAWLNGLTVVQLQKETTDLPKGRVSDALTVLSKLPNKQHMQPQDELPVPAGRYAVESLTEGELRFFRVWRGSRNPNVVKVYVLHGPDETEMFRGAATAVLKNIMDAGVREAAIRYGHEIGVCSRCGRRLTNRISRELGIGPVCGGRYWEDFGEQVSAARQRIVDRGEDPDEEME